MNVETLKERREKVSQTHRKMYTSEIDPDELKSGYYAATRLLDAAIGYAEQLEKKLGGLVDPEPNLVKQERDALKKALAFALRHCDFFVDGTETCESRWHNEAHSCHSTCPGCGGPVATTSLSQRRQVTRYTAVSERVQEMLNEGVVALPG